MTYLDTTTDRYYEAYAVLVDAHDPSLPPLCVRVSELLLEERFVEVKVE